MAGAAIINSIMIEAARELLRRGKRVPVLPSANIEGVSEEMAREAFKLAGIKLPLPTRFTRREEQL